MSNIFYLIVSLITLLLLFLAPTLLAYADYPTLTQHVTDLAGILSYDEIQNLETSISTIQSSTSIEIAIVTVPTTDGEARVLYASHLGEQNGIGKKADDNGIVILWSQDNELGGAIATGRGIGSVITDLDVSRIGRECKNDLYEARYYNGFNCILNGISTRLQEYATTGETNSSGGIKSIIDFFKRHWIFTFILLFILSIVIITALNSSSPGTGGAFRSSSYVGRSFGSFGSGSSFGGFSGGSGGTGGFGGGSFGGGGGGF